MVKVKHVQWTGGGAGCVWGCRAEMELDLGEGGAWYWGLCEVVFRVPAHFGWAVVVMECYCCCLC